MVEIEIQKESDTEHSVEADGHFIGSYFPGDGIILESSEGSAIPVQTIRDTMEYLIENYENGKK